MARDWISDLICALRPTEQAVELLNQQTSDPEQSRQILRQAGIRLGEAAAVTAEGADRAALQVRAGTGIQVWR